MSIINIFTDGSSLIRHNKYESSSGSIILIDGISVIELGMYHENGTNSIGEIYAIVQALDRLTYIINQNPQLHDSEINIYSDSEYVINSINKWIYGWMKQGFNNFWYGASGKPVMYQNIFKYIYSTYISKDRDKLIGNQIKFYHMRGHVNEKVKIDTAYNSFNSKNSCSISLEEFKYLVSKNHDVDKLCESVRLGKLLYYEKVYNQELYKIDLHTRYLRDNHQLIKSRIDRR
jgi:ribonuclease HI